MLVMCGVCDAANVCVVACGPATCHLLAEGCSGGVESWKLEEEIKIFICAGREKRKGERKREETTHKTGPVIRNVC